MGFTHFALLQKLARRTAGGHTGAAALHNRAPPPGDRDIQHVTRCLFSQHFSSHSRDAARPACCLQQLEQMCL
jgi:hypothetical protein